MVPSLRRHGLPPMMGSRLKRVLRLQDQTPWARKSLAKQGPPYDATWVRSHAETRPGPLRSCVTAELREAPLTLP
jgi:hypothetical protein